MAGDFLTVADGDDRVFSINLNHVSLVSIDPYGAAAGNKMRVYVSVVGHERPITLVGADAERINTAISYRQADG